MPYSKEFIMTSKSVILILFFLSLTKFSLADQPPCWCKFEIKSKNEKFIAVVERLHEDSLKQPRLSKWTLTVYAINKKVKKLLWATSYDYSGYTDGQLSDDGKYFVYVEYWYYAQSPLVKIYKSGEHINSDSLTGLNFKIPSDKLGETVSHWLWLSDANSIGFQKNSTGNFIYSIRTIDGKIHFIDIDKATFMNTD